MGTAPHLSGSRGVCTCKVGVHGWKLNGALEHSPAACSSRLQVDVDAPELADGLRGRVDVLEEVCARLPQLHTYPLTNSATSSEAEPATARRNPHMPVALCKAPLWLGHLQLPCREDMTRLHQSHARQSYRAAVELEGHDVQ